MESKVRDRAFDPFFSTKKGSQSSGMGLASVYGIVQQHRGMVELESSPGMGTRIDIYLPLTTEPLAAVVEDSHPDSVGGHETILVVEDEDRVRRTQVKMLEALGYTVVEAANGKIALGVLADNENPVDLILSDVSMPEMGGQDLYDQARGLHPEIAFVFTSGYTGTSFLDRFQHGETVHFLPKPHSMADLAGIIRRALVGS
jgi:CheY-like chemotaxis protein